VWPISVGLLLGLVFAGADDLSGHVAWIVMKRSRLFFARLLLIWILVVGHEMLLLTVEKRSHAGFVPRIGHLLVQKRVSGYGQDDLLVERPRSCESTMCRLQMIGNATEHSKAIPQNPAGPKRANSQPESMVASAVAPPIPTVP
jgi:hypothetical protein